MTGLKSVKIIFKGKYANCATFIELRIAKTFGTTSPKINKIKDKKIISMRPGPIEACQPFGIASYETSAEFESITLKSVRIN